MFLMLCKCREERARKEKKRSREEEEVVGVFVCPRRPLSSHYQGIRQMLPLYRCWFDSEPPTVIPSSLLAPTTPRQRLLSSSLHSALTTTTSSPNLVWIQLFNSFLLFVSHEYTRAHTDSKNTNTTRITWFTASVNLSAH